MLSCGVESEMIKLTSEMGLKGITIFRDGYKGEQVLTLGNGESLRQHERVARCDPNACKL